MGTLLNKNEDNCRVTRCHVFGHVSKCINCLCRDSTSRAVSHLQARDSNSCQCEQEAPYCRIASDCFGCAGKLWQLAYCFNENFLEQDSSYISKKSDGGHDFLDVGIFLKWGQPRGNWLVTLAFSRYELPCVPDCTCSKA